MKLNLDKIWGKISHYSNLSQFDYVEVNQKLGKAHTHNILTKDIITSSTFSSYFSSHTQYFQKPEFWEYGYKGVGIKLSNFENKLFNLSLNSDNIQEEIFYPYLKLLTEYYFIKNIRFPEVCNFNPWKYKTKDDLKDLEILTHKVKNLYPLLNTNPPSLEQIAEVYRGIYVNSWGCIEIGEYDIAIWLANFTYSLSKIAITQPELNIQIPQAPVNHPHQHKPLFSSGLALAKAYNGKGQVEKALEVYYHLLDVPDNFKGGYSFSTRRLEVALEIFNISPTKDHKDLVLKWFFKSIIYDHDKVVITHEQSREKCLIILYLLKSLYNYKIK